MAEAVITRQRSIYLNERANNTLPMEESCWIWRARDCGLRYDFSAAKKCIEKAVRCSSSPAETLAEGGQRCLDFSNFEMATAFFERAILEKEFLRIRS